MGIIIDARSHVNSILLYDREYQLDPRAEKFPADLHTNVWHDRCIVVSWQMYSRHVQYHRSGLQLELVMQTAYAVHKIVIRYLASRSDHSLDS